MKSKQPITKDAKFSDLLGKTLSFAEYTKEDEQIIFQATTGETYLMFHEQDCCESVGIEDIIGDLDDLIGSPILMAEEASSVNEDPEGITKQREVGDDSFTWTFYKLATLKGYVTLRWYGTSNGYYSESVDFKEIIGWK